MRVCRFVLAGALSLSIGLAPGCSRQHTEEQESAATQAPADVVELEGERLQNAGIETVSVAPERLSVPLVVPGHISFDMNHTARITSTMDGRVVEMKFDVGDRVKRDEVMALVDSPQLLKPLELKAAIDGRVVERQGAVGGLLDHGGSLYTVSDISTLWCIAAVHEEDVGAVRAGQPAAVSVLSFPGETFAGRVSLIGDTVGETTRTVDVRVEVNNPDAKLRAGMFATVTLHTSQVASGLFVPDAALQTVRGETAVFVEESPGRFRMVPVTLGRQLGEVHELLGGIDSGARVVTKGSFILKSELLKAELQEED